jgi:hypothetical protein
MTTTSFAGEGATSAPVKRRTGPRTAAGKARSKRNALRHGLSVPLLADIERSKEVMDLSQKIAGEGARAEVKALAFDVARAQIDLQRVRQARLKLLCGNSSNSGRNSRADGQHHFDDAAELIAASIRELWALDRYERRALSRRRFAIRSLDAALRSEPPRGGPPSRQ